MDLNSTRDLTRERFDEVRVYLGVLAELEPEDALQPSPPELKIQKGLYYVHLYSALEKCVNAAVERSLLHISSKSVKGVDYSEDFYAIALENKLRGVSDASAKSFFKKAADAFDVCRCVSPVAVNEMMFQYDLQNVWPKTIEEVFRAFGIRSFQLDDQEITVLKEVVNNRNAVAHGRESALAIGERHNVRVLRERYNKVREISVRIIDTLELYCNNKYYIKDCVRDAY